VTRTSAIYTAFGYVAEVPGKQATLADVANTAVFLASDHAAAMSGAVANLTCGMSVD
jgi:enoyl-[acyl-carrier-protein] reductase (NADH)